MKLAISLIQVLLIVGTAPLLRGVVARIKARIQNRRGASVFRPYADLWKLFRKEDLVPSTASLLFRLCPVILFAATLMAAAFVPVLHVSALLGDRGDFILLVYLLALARFFLVLGAMDGGSSFGGMGASREALVSALAEAPLLLGLIAIAVVSHSASIASIVRWAISRAPFVLSPAHAFACVALVLVTIAETGRVPVDNPSTHLELTMIHEAMVLEYSGPSLALIEWANAIKLNLMLALLVALFVPWGVAATISPVALAIALLCYPLKIALLAVALAALESSVAKLRMYLVPEYLGTACALSVLAVVFTAFTR
jgi:formate hydrogenlyase subunit 4